MAIGVPWKEVYHGPNSFLKLSEVLLVLEATMDGSIDPEEGSRWSAIIYTAMPKLDLHLLEDGLKHLAR